MGMGFLFEKKILTRLEKKKKKTIFALTCFVLKIPAYFHNKTR